MKSDTNKQEKTTYTLEEKINQLKQVQKYTNTEFADNNIIIATLIIFHMLKGGQKNMGMMWSGSFNKYTKGSPRDEK